MAQYVKRIDIFSQHNCKHFRKHFVNHASDFVKKLPDPTGKFGIPSVRQYYKGFNSRKKNFNFKF